MQLHPLMVVALILGIGLVSFFVVHTIHAYDHKKRREHLNNRLKQAKASGGSGRVSGAPGNNKPADEAC